jgi:hypothetical protein
MILGSNEAMSEELAQLRAMIMRDNQLPNGATPRASGSGPRSGPPTSRDPPVALGQPALDPPPAPPANPPRPTAEERPRRFVPLPTSKAAKNLKDIQSDTGLGDNPERWLEISVSIFLLILYVVRTLQPYRILSAIL